MIWLYDKPDSNPGGYPQGGSANIRNLLSINSIQYNYQYNTLQVITHKESDHNPGTLKHISCTSVNEFEFDSQVHRTHQYEIG